MQKIIILSDFNGTISLIDIAEFTLKTFVKQDWGYYDNLFQEGKLSLEESTLAQHSFLKTPKDLILMEIEKVSSLREDFSDLISFCSKNDIEFIIITSGLDFIIHHILNNLGISNNIKLVSVRATFNKDQSLLLTAPERFDLSIKDFKLDHVMHYKALGFKVIYIGDSNSDFQAVLGADLIFAVHESKLAKYCFEKRLNYVEFEKFNEVKRKIQKEFFD